MIAAYRYAIIRLAHKLPKGSPERKVILSSLTDKDTLLGNQRIPYLSQIWDMYVTTYRTIGLHLSNPNELLEYDVWDVFFKEGEPIAFGLFKRTPFGLKGALSGNNGSSEGRATFLLELRTIFQRNGVYGELSHKPRDIAIHAGSPAVCAKYAPQILGKNVEIDLDNPINYYRHLPGIGRVQKTLLGRPNGFPTTDPKNPSCPILPDGVRMGGNRFASEKEAAEERAVHYFEEEISEWARRTSDTTNPKDLLKK